MNYFNNSISNKEKFRFTIKALDRVPITLEGINNTGKPFKVSSVIALNDKEEPLVSVNGVVLDFGDIIHFYSFGVTPNGLTILKAYDENNRTFFENPKTNEITKRSKEFNFDAYLINKDNKPLEEIESSGYFTKFHNGKLLRANIGKPVLIMKDGGEYLSVIVDYSQEKNYDRIIAIYENMPAYDMLSYSDSISEFNYYDFLNYEAKQNLKS